MQIIVHSFLIVFSRMNHIQHKDPGIYHILQEVKQIPKTRDLSISLKHSFLPNTSYH